MTKKPLIIINCKTYVEGSGKEARRLAKNISTIKNIRANIIMSVQAPDIYACSKTKTKIIAQHFNTSQAGANTGDIHIKSLIENGAKGSLINHSEKRLPLKEIAKRIALLQEAKLQAIVCVKTPKEAQKVAKLRPELIAIEPPKLIGGTISVTTADPKIITKTIEQVRKVNTDVEILCGAGIKTKEDVKKALKLGCRGVLLASGIIKQKNQKKALEQIIP
jgi:triosephosphate isomerase (TIM)